MTALKISMAMLAYKLKPFNPELHLSEQDKPVIKSLKFISQFQTSFDPSCVYLGEAAAFPDALPTEEPVNIISVGSKDSFTASGDNQLLNLIVLQDNWDLFAIANELQNIFEFYCDWDSELQDSLIKSKGLQHIIDISFKVLENPMYLIDPSFRTLSYSKEVGSDAIDDLWESIVLNGHTDLATVNAMKENNALSWLNSCREPIINSSAIFTRPRINANIMIGAEKIGTLIVIETDTRLEEAHLHMAKHLVNIIRLAMQKDVIYQNTRGAIYSYFIADLLEGKALKKNIIERQLKFLDWSITDNYYLLKVKVSEYDLINDTLNYTAHQLETIFSGSRSIIYQKHIVLIIHVDSSGTLPEETLSRLESILKNSKLKASLSSCCGNFSELHEYYTQTNIAMELAEKYGHKNCLVKYDDYVIEHLLSTAVQSMDLHKVCHPALLQLQAYDEKNKTKYLNDLRVYIKNNKNLVNSAKELFIHRNTFVYRLNKIMQLVNLDLSDEGVKSHLLLSYKILEFLKVSAEAGSREKKTGDPSAGSFKEKTL